MTMSATRLRANLYRLLDEVLESGIPLEIERNGQILRIMPPRRRVLEELFPPDDELVVGDPADLVDVDWSDEWSP